ncbi:hypothetical protein [Andreprevotia chitinilytica]|uniref:hypothetical protein n=1 Tax=Andreprevotia chitinilytica TaxID=396808 RepID=UPI00055894FD|nr:hypothetical protein [Andreprevotia chitinilytica]
MKASIIVGILLIALGAGILVLGNINYKTEEKVFELGPLKATAEKEKSVALPPLLGWALVIGGIAVLVVGSRKK